MRKYSLCFPINKNIKKKNMKCSELLLCWKKQITKPQTLKNKSHPFINKNVCEFSQMPWYKIKKHKRFEITSQYR